MPSCTNNSTITGVILNTEDVVSGRRLSFKQDTSKNWNSGISAGDVIRFDVDQTQYTKSIANPNYGGSFDLSNAEVVGIVEEISQDISGVTYATIVTHGLMNYPGLLTIVSGISASAGGDGGTDVFFLNPETPGGITFEVQPGLGYIAKPVLQLCPTSDGRYNSIVVNYIGYETAESESYTVSNSEFTVGQLRIVDSAATVPTGWIDSSTSQFLSITEYPTAYDLYGTDYGGKETLTVNGSSSFVSSLLNSYIRPINPTTAKGIGTYSQIVSVDTVNNKVVVEHSSTGFTLWKNTYTQYELKDTVSSIKKITVTNGELTHFKTPVLQTNINVFAGNDQQVVNFTTKTLLRVKPDTRVSYLPDSAVFNSIEVSGTLSTANVPDVDTKIVNLETRIQALEQILGI